MSLASYSNPLLALSLFVFHDDKSITRGAIANNLRSVENIPKRKARVAGIFAKKDDAMV